MIVFIYKWLKTDRVRTWSYSMPLVSDIRCLIRIVYQKTPLAF